MRKVILVLLCALPLVSQKQPQPKLSNDNLTADQIAVYRAFLKSYDNESKKTVNVSDRTAPFGFWHVDVSSCLKRMIPENLNQAKATIHRFRRNQFQGVDMRLVDAEKQHEIIKNNDPQDLVWHAIEKGVELTKEDVAKSVDAAFASGLLQLSEIVFDKKHHFAMIMFDFECGSLCGDGAVLVFEKTDGKWKQATGGKCAEWVS